MSYETEPLYKIIKITKADLFAALCIGLSIGAFLWTMTSSALTVQPSQEFGKTMLSGKTLEVKPVAVTSFNDITEPNDIQPAMGVNMYQRTTNPQTQELQ
jgi:hypothetical protein